MESWVIDFSNMNTVSEVKGKADVRDHALSVILKSKTPWKLNQKLLHDSKMQLYNYKNKEKLEDDSTGTKK